MQWFEEKNETFGILLNITSREEYSSPFQKIEVLHSLQYGKILVLDGLIQTTEKDEFIYHEMLSHIPMLAHPSAADILVIGGGDGGVVREICKYNNTRVTLVEIDQMVIEVSLKEFPSISSALKNDNVSIIYEDGSTFIKTKKNAYDIILVDCSDPVSHSASLFKEQFFIDVKEALKHDGVFAFQSESPIAHLDFLTQTRKVLLRFFPIVKHYFAPIPTYPTGFWSFTFASFQYQPSLNTQTKTILQSLQTKYLNQEIYEASFAMPDFVKQALQ
ncbi:MAG: spermidine synthase [Candidatus Fischerbacteria bacterium RBG_13_37_8]|uniref:Polyamine aminopropyltransferase n=1 Tax=Candidatus Fischerbacteria bacterium RBG_13_37_8 TaxID=1817863 RepID=A0A1F5VFK9_9BACT|nr:MAG: spermidine synthase [Candidatus Fischerbacteria bacterium RBG_13_37_8]